MSFATSDLEVQEEVAVVAVGTMKNEHYKRKVVAVVVAAVSKLNLCGRIIKEEPDLFDHFILMFSYIYM